jgi:hypothetical protein
MLYIAFQQCGNHGSTMAFSVIIDCQLRDINLKITKLHIHLETTPNRFPNEG